MMKKCERCGELKDMMSWESLCYQCFKAKNLEDSQRSVREPEDGEDIDTFSSDYVICPYCGCAIPTDLPYSDFPEIFIDGDHEIDCPECEKTYILETGVSYSYETRRKKED